MKVRKIAANYIYLPGFSLVKNGYVVLEEEQVKEVADTGGQIREIQGLEFYGGLIVPDYVKEFHHQLKEGERILPWLEELYCRQGNDYRGIGIFEGADLIKWVWKRNAHFRLL